CADSTPASAKAASAQTKRRHGIFETPLGSGGRTGWVGVVIIVGSITSSYRRGSVDRLVALISSNHPSPVRFRFSDEPLDIVFTDEFIAENTGSRIFSGVIMAQFGGQNGF